MATSTEGVKRTKRRKRSEIEEGPNAENPQSDQKPEPTAADPEPEVLPEKKRRKKKKTVGEDAIATNVDAQGNPVVDSSKSIEIKQSEILGKPEGLAAAAEAKPELLAAAEADAIIETVQSKKKKKQKKSTEGKRSEVEDGVDAENPESVQNPQLDQKPELAPADANADVLLKKKRRKKKKTVAEYAIATNVDSSNSIEIKQAENLGKPELLAEAAEAEAIIETVQSMKKKKKQRKSTEGKRSEVGDGVDAENPESVQNLQLDQKPELAAADAEVMPKKKRLKKKKKTVAEDATRTNADTERSPVVDASKSIEIEQTQLLQKPEIAAEAEAKKVPEKKKKKKKKTVKKKISGTEEPIVINVAAAEGNPIGDGLQSVEINHSQLLQKPEFSAVAKQVPVETYVEICVICRRKGHSIPTCPEVNDELNYRKRGNWTLRSHTERQCQYEKKRSKCRRPPQDAETKIGQANRSLVTGSAVQDDTMVAKTCSGKEDESIAKAGKEDKSVAKAGSAADSKKGRVKKSK